jgi:dephospho-CoA kinase
VDGALLMEGIFKDIVDVLILVYINKDIQIKRLMERNLIGYEEAISRINSQMPFEEKKKYADYIIDNSYDVEYTKNQLNKIMYEILSVEDVND